MSPSKRSMHQSQQEETVIRTDEVASNAPAKSRRTRTAGWRGYATGLVALASVLGVALVPALGTSPAGAIGPALTVVTGHAGTTAPSLGVPIAEGSAQINPTYVAYGPNGDTAVTSTKGGSVYVYLIAGATEANEYNIQTGVGPATFGSLTAGDAYIVAGTGTAGLIAQPGNNQFGNSTTAVATSNPIEPTSVAFDPNGNLLIAGENTGAGNSAIQVVAKASGTFYGISMTAGDLYTIADVGLSGSPSSAINMGNVAAPANGMSVDTNGNIAVGNGDGVDFVNEQSSGSLSLYGLTIPHQSSAVLAGTAQGGTDCAAAAAHAAAKSLYFQSPEPFFDGSDNVYFSDNEIGGASGGGCVWVLPAQSGSLDGMAVTAGNVYKLAGNGGTTATPDGTAGVQANLGRHQPGDPRLRRERRPRRAERFELRHQPCHPGLGGDDRHLLRHLHDRGRYLYRCRRPVEPLDHAEWSHLRPQRRERCASLHGRPGVERQPRRTDRCARGCSRGERRQPELGRHRGRDERDHHVFGAQLHRRHRRVVRRDRRHQFHGEQRDADHGHRAGGQRRDGRCHGDHTGRHLDDVERRPLHLYRRTGGDRRQPDLGSRRRRNERDDHRHRADRRHRRVRSAEPPPPASR